MHRTLFRALMAAVSSAALAVGQPRFSERILQKLHNEAVTGYALRERTLVIWGDRLLWRGLPQGNFQVVRGRGTRHLIDMGVYAPDMLSSSLLGHRGFVLFLLVMQVRFYEIPADPTSR